MNGASTNYSSSRYELTPLVSASQLGLIKGSTSLHKVKPMLTLYRCNEIIALYLTILMMAQHSTAPYSLIYHAIIAMAQIQHISNST